MSRHTSTLSRMFESLQYKNFRLYFLGLCVSQTGTWMQQIAMSWLVYRLTGSYVLLAAVMFLSQIPTLFVSPFASALTDRYNRKKLLLLTQSLSMASALVLTILAYTNTVEVWHLLALSFLSGCIMSLDLPTRQALYSSFVPSHMIGNAVAVNSSVINGSKIFGPAIAGFVILELGENACFLLNFVSYGFAIWALALIEYSQTSKDGEEQMSIGTEIKEGWSYLNKNFALRSLLITSTIFSFCAFSSTTFMTPYVKDILHGESDVLGWLMASLGVGSFASAMYLALRKSIVGLLNVLASAMFMASLSLIPFFYIDQLWLVLIFAFFLGFGIICSVAAINTLFQALSSNAMRGRIMGYFSMSVIGSSAVGSLFWGWLCTYLPLADSMALSGFICLLTAIAYKYKLPKISSSAHMVYVKHKLI